MPVSHPLTQDSVLKYKNNDELHKLRMKVITNPLHQNAANIHNSGIPMTLFSVIPPDSPLL